MAFKNYIAKGWELNSALLWQWQNEVKRPCQQLMVGLFSSVCKILVDPKQISVVSKSKKEKKKFSTTDPVMLLGPPLRPTYLRNTTCTFLVGPRFISSGPFKQCFEGGGLVSSCWHCRLFFNPPKNFRLTVWGQPQRFKLYHDLTEACLLLVGLALSNLCELIRIHAWISQIRTMFVNLITLGDAQNSYDVYI